MWFIEESMPDGSYRIIRNALSAEQALSLLSTYPSNNRLEMWADGMADSPKGFAPAAFRQNGKTMISNTLKMLMY